MSFPKILHHSIIPLKDIIQATNNFAKKNIIEQESGYNVYKGELHGKNVDFVLFDRGFIINFHRVIHLPKHQNIVPFIGCCDKDHRLILVLEHPSRGGLDKHVSGAHLTWLIRVQICIDIASGLHYLLNHRQTCKMDIGDLSSASIHLDENWRAKIHLFRPSALIYTFAHASNSVFRHLEDISVHDEDGISYVDISKCYRVQLGYVDPLYIQTGMQSAIYSFGVILFEVLCARPAVTYDEEGGEQFLSKLARSHYEKGTLIEIIDPVLRVQMNTDSVAIFSELAYRCLSEDLSIRPTISVAIEQLQKVLKLQQGFVTSELQQVRNIQHMKIPLQEIRSATRNFTNPDKTGKVYKAELSHFDVDRYVAENKIKRVSMEEILEYPRRKGTVAIKSNDGRYGQRTEEQLQTLLYLSHENLVKLVGFCDEDDGRIHVVYENASNGSLDEYIHSQHIIKRHKTERNMFPWVMRLQFCLEAARGLNFLHNGNTRNHTIIHGNIKSSNILISQDGVGMIGDFGLSTNEYNDTHRLTKEYDVYSFGLVLFEVLSGVLTHFMISEDDPKFLPDIVKRGSNQIELDNIIDPMLRQEFEKYRSLIGNQSAESLNMFAKLAYRCFAEVENRPTMVDIVEELEKAYKYHVESLEQRQKDEDNSKLTGSESISHEEIKSATDDFSKERLIGSGASGKIYKTELSFSKKSIPVAVKRLHRASYYKEGAFLKDVVKLSRYVHENIITLRGFCEEDDEKIIIMDHAIKGSLDKHLDKATLTWGIRLKISIGAAKGLNHIHSFEEDQNTVHGDIKSNNILLDHEWKASISDFIVSKTHGTEGYLDPQYFSSGSTKETDVYSFGVVLFEILSGKRAIEKAENYSHPTLRQIINDERERYAGDGAEDKKVSLSWIALIRQVGDGAEDKKVFLDWMAARCFEENKIEALIFDNLTKQTDAKSIEVVSKVAYQCLHKAQKERPTMAFVIQELENALKIHVEWEFKQKLPKDNENIMKMIEQPEFQEITKKDLYSIFSSGILLNNGKVVINILR